MAQLYKSGEQKIRPGTYYRYTGQNGTNSAGAMDGVNAIVINAAWGPVGTVTKHTKAGSVTDTYGTGDGANVAETLFEGGASTIFVYRAAGTGSAKGTVSVGGGTLTAKYDGARPISVKIQVKPGDSQTKQALVLDGTTLLETFDFPASGATEGTALATAFNSSQYVSFTTSNSAEIAVGEYKLAGGKNPTLTAQDYANGFEALESYRYNVLTTDTMDEGVATVLESYVSECEKTGKWIMGVVGALSSTAFDTRKANAKAVNNKGIIYLGSGFITAGGEIYDGAKAINYTAGVISSTPSNEAITHKVVPIATDLTENLTNAQYESAIENGLLLLSKGPEGQVWFDSGINTLTVTTGNDDGGWKKIKRTKVRYELLDRIDRVVAPLVGRINCDADGVATVIQAGMGIIKTMVSERKLLSGGEMIVDPENPYGADSAWFLISVDDADALEKIYMHYQFRYSQSV